MSLLVSWLHRIWIWLAEVPTFWAFLVVLAAALGVPLLLSASADDAVRYSGLALQLVGVGVVAFTLRGRGKLFGRASVMRFAWEWAHRVPRLRQRGVTLGATGTATMRMSATADATVWRGPRLDQPIQAQLEAIRENLTTLKGQVEAQDSRTSTRIAELRSAIEAESTQRTAQIHETKRKLEEATADSLYIEVAGLAWLIAGIVLATIPLELTALFRWVAQ